MAKLEVERVKNDWSGFAYTITSEGLKAHANFDPTTGVAEVAFDEAENMAAALQAVVDTLVDEADKWKTSPVLLLRIDINAGKFEKDLKAVAPRFGFTGPQPAGEFGSTGQFVRFRAELPLSS